MSVFFLCRFAFVCVCVFVVCCRYYIRKTSKFLECAVLAVFVCVLPGSWILWLLAQICVYLHYR